MLTITVSEKDRWSDEENKFLPGKSAELELEHSLVSLSSWESKWKKPFLSDGDERTEEQQLSYIKFMTLNDFPEEMYQHLSRENVKAISEYINDKPTATWFAERRRAPGTGAPKKEIVTAEIIYFWMVSWRIPFECQYWHLERLITLIRVCSEKNKGAEKQSPQDKKQNIADRKALNAARRAKTGSKG